MNWKEIRELQDLHIKNMVMKLSPGERKTLARTLRILLYINNMVIGFLAISLMFYALAQLAGYELHITGTGHCCLPCPQLNQTNNCSTLLPLLNEIPAHHTNNDEYHHANNERI